MQENRQWHFCTYIFIFVTRHRGITLQWSQCISPCICILRLLLRMFSWIMAITVEESVSGNHCRSVTRTCSSSPLGLQKVSGPRDCLRDLSDEHPDEDASIPTKSRSPERSRRTFARFSCPPSRLWTNCEQIAQLKQENVWLLNFGLKIRTQMYFGTPVSLRMPFLCRDSTTEYPNTPWIICRVLWSSFGKAQRQSIWINKRKSFDRHQLRRFGNNVVSIAALFGEQFTAQYAGNSSLENLFLRRLIFYAIGRAAVVKIQQPLTLLAQEIAWSDFWYLISAGTQDAAKQTARFHAKCS